MDFTVGMVMEWLFVYFTATILVVFTHGFKNFSMDKVRKTAEQYWGRCVLGGILFWFIIITALYIASR